MPLARIRKDMPEHNRKPLPEGAKADQHLAMVRLLPCVICGREPCGIAHHLLKPESGVRGTNRAWDKWATPLCIEHHDANFPDSLHKHGGEEDWFALHDIDGRGLAKGLWTARGNLEQMRGVVRLHRDLAELRRKRMERPFI